MFAPRRSGAIGPKEATESGFLDGTGAWGGSWEVGCPSADGLGPGEGDLGLGVHLRFLLPVPAGGDMVARAEEEGFAPRFPPSDRMTRARLESAHASVTALAKARRALPGVFRVAGCPVHLPRPC